MENDAKTISTLQNITTLWLGGERRDTPVLQIKPLEMARHYKLHKPCRILLEGRPELGGVLIKYFGPSKKNKEAKE